MGRSTTLSLGTSWRPPSHVPTRPVAATIKELTPCLFSQTVLRCPHTWLASIHLCLPLVMTNAAPERLLLSWHLPQLLPQLVALRPFKLVELIHFVIVASGILLILRYLRGGCSCKVLEPHKRARPSNPPHPHQRTLGPGYRCLRFFAAQVRASAARLNQKPHCPKQRVRCMPSLSLARSRQTCAAPWLRC